jgi:hypothetical protein
MPVISNSLSDSARLQVAEPLVRGDIKLGDRSCVMVNLRVRTNTYKCERPRNRRSADPKRFRFAIAPTKDFFARSFSAGRAPTNADFQATASAVSTDHHHNPHRAQFSRSRKNHGQQPPTRRLTQIHPPRFTPGIRFASADDRRSWREGDGGSVDESPG